MYGLLGVGLDTCNDVPTAVLKADFFPSGHTMAPMCEHCIQTHNVTPLNHCPFGTDLLCACHKHFHTSGAPVADSTANASCNNAMDRFREVHGRPEGACLACGCEDNTVGH